MDMDEDELAGLLAEAGDAAALEAACPDYAAGARVLMEFARSDRDGFIGLSEVVRVMSVDNLPCELPKDASEGFGEMFMKHVIPAFFNGGKDGILQRAKITENGKLTPRFAYLQDYVDGK